jgi:hypothetical protein
LEFQSGFQLEWCSSNPNKRIGLDIFRYNEAKLNNSWRDDIKTAS